jgi:hypothetical protein
MDDFGRHLADETTEIMPEAVASASAELRKRRSTRIVQAVPLQVTGVDALGRPFVERTSSLILNCHGCRYQSKHYVLKNMWVKLEVPHPEADQAPREVRGRVAWIQRPRTVRQLFQVALELEVPGNVWGIGFPPEDWFAFKEAEKAQAAAAGAAHGISQVIVPPPQPTPAPAQPPASESEFQVSLAEPDFAASNDTDKVRVFPSPASATDASLQLARQVTRLLAEARQQIQAAAREAAAQAVSAERRISAEQWEQKLAVAREELSHEISRAIARIQEESAAHSHAVQTSAAALQEELPGRIAPHLEELTRNLTGQLSEAALAQRAEHEQQLTSAVETLRAASRQAEEAAERLGQREEQATASLAARAEEAQRAVEEAARQREEALNAQREAVNAAASEIQQQIAAALASAQSSWHGHLTGEIAAAQTRLQIAVEQALATAQERAAGSLSEHANTLLPQLQQEAERLAGALREAATGAAGQAEQQLSGLLESIQKQIERMETARVQASEASERLEHLSARLELVQQQALSGFQAQVDDVLSLHRNELHRRSESIFEEIAARIRGAVEESSREGVSQFTQQIDSLIQPQIAKTEEALQRLAGSRSLLEGAVALQQDRIRTTTDEAFAQALAEFRGNLGSVEQSLQESAEGVAARSLSELEAKAETVKHQTVEDVLKSAEWYEKRTQTQIQGIAERIGEQTGTQLREKAGEISTEFANEMDQSSRNFLSYAQSQMAELVSDSFERARSLFSEAAETTSAAFIDEIQQHARQDLEGFEGELEKSTTETKSQMEAAHAELTQRVTAEQEDFLRRFQEAMSGAIEAGVAEANQKVQAGFEPLLKSWKSMIDTHQEEMHGIYARIGEQAAGQYRERLENVSNQWMLATVTSLDHQSRDVVAGIAATAEERLRETCTKVFGDIGDALRERLQQIASNLTVPPRVGP